MSLSDVPRPSSTKGSRLRAPRPSVGMFSPLGASSSMWAGDASSGLRSHPPLPPNPNADDVTSGTLFGQQESTAGNPMRLSLTVLGMSPLHADSSVVRPFVRVWLVNGLTGESLLHSMTGRSSFALTHPVDLRLRRTRAPWWGAELLLAVPSQSICDASSNAVLLLEVLEGGGETIQGLPFRREGLYPVCWGFLKLRDSHGRLNFRNRLHIQMFPFPHRTSCFTRLLQLVPSFLLPYSSLYAWGNVGCQTHISTPEPGNFQSNASPKTEGIVPISSLPPELFFVYRDPRNRKVPYSAGMVISLKRVLDVDAYHPKEATVLPSEEYLLNQMFLGDEPRPRRSISAPMWLSGTRQTRYTSLNFANTAALAKSYIREVDERVVPPTNVLQWTRLQGKITCVAFSYDGTFLAFGVTSGFDHLVQLRSALVPEMPVVGVFRGHVGHIHRVVFHKDNVLFLSCSSDKTVKVWRRDCSGPLMDTYSDLHTGCICTLPHGFAVYDATFHQDHIITCGYDQRLFVWRFDKNVEETHTELNSGDTPLQNSRDRRSTLQSSSAATMIPPFSFGVESVTGELVHMTSGDEEAIIHSICASELNRLWSVDALGNVVVWRAMYECMKDGKRVWQMSIRHRFKCPGATRVELYGSRALVTCAKSPVAYVFDASTNQLMHEIALHQRPYIPAVTLLPDGEAIVAGTHDGKLLSWECSSGTLCTPKSGYAKVQVNFPIGSIVWCRDEQLCVLLSTEGSAVTHATDSSASRATMAAVIGTPRTEESVIVRGNSRAPDYFRARFGGELMARRSNRNPSWGEVASFRPNADSGKPSRAPTLASHNSFSRDKSTRMGQIIAMWKGLVGHHHHKHTGDAENLLRDPTAVYIQDDR
ncbi:putative jouberin-like [Trypanosoma grayi]|uniref:putative jouberin-like n=1 Tax=Trypanosoma grayi TaxID=71804 RepID=UPI0004F4988C|nr:putative jouberin-like [Trypanosoma grayi]KEG12985.1 putative jouberin-like [Trypanosoma grayi]